MKKRQIFFTRPHTAELQIRDVPEVRENEVLAEMIYTVVSGGTERANLVGLPNVPGEFPRSLGYCGVGIVREIGSAVRSVSVGDRVLVYHGNHADYNIRTEDEITRVDTEDVSSLEAAFVIIASMGLGGVRKLDEIVWVGEGLAQAVQELTVFAPVRKLDAGDREATLVGLKERTLESGSLNALPESWQEVLQETRFKAKLVKRLIIAGGVWALIMAVFLAVPLAFGFMTDHQKDLCKRHAKQYQSVKDKKAKVDMVRKYSDHSRGALEILKGVSDRLPPEGIELVSWEFRRDSGVSINAESDDNALAYTFKDNLSEMGTEEEDGEPVFEVVNLGPLSGKARKRFRIDCQYKVAEE